MTFEFEFRSIFANVGAVLQVPDTGKNLSLTNFKPSIYKLPMMHSDQ